MMRLRLLEGMPLDDFQRHVSILIRAIPKKRFQDLEKEGLLELSKTLKLTFEGTK